jgi:protein ImuB
MIASVWFPELAMNRWRRLSARERALPPDDEPIVLKIDGTHGPVVHAANAAAKARGVAVGARVVDIRAILPDLHVEHADPEGDLAALDEMARWADRWCPRTARDGVDGIVLDLTGSDHLWGGPHATVQDIEERFTATGMRARASIAPTRGGAWALARYADAARIMCGPDELEASLAPLPVAALRLEEDQVHLLDRLGLKTIGALAALPRPALNRRFPPRRGNTNPVEQLDRATGVLPDPLDTLPPPTRFIARTRLAEPVMDIAPHLPRLAAQLAGALTRADRGARALRLIAYRTDGGRREEQARMAAATRDPDHMVRLLSGRLDRIDPGFGFDLFTLEAVWTEPLRAGQSRLDGSTDRDRDLARLVDRLTTRLGERAVSWTCWRESHLPERVERTVPAASGAKEPFAQQDAPLHERPLRLLDRPEEVQVLYAVPEGPPLRFSWRAAAHRVTRREGPERIAPEWWHDRPGTRLRDYWKVEVEDGRRFWLYREGVHGDGRGAHPRWFVHGLFA